MKKICYYLIAILFSHDILFCMQQTLKKEEVKAISVIFNVVKKQNAPLSEMIEVTLEPQKCPICRDFLQEKTVTTSCGHQFDINCLGDWLMASKKCDCPCCRSKFTLPESVIASIGTFKISDFPALERSIIDELRTNGVLLKENKVIPEQSHVHHHGRDAIFCGLSAKAVVYFIVFLVWFFPTLFTIINSDKIANIFSHIGVTAFLTFWPCLLVECVSRFYP